MAPRTTSPYHLLACDLDGTLMGAEITISTRVRRALAAAQARGVSVTLATGRGFPETLPFAQLLNITIPIICYQGGLIKHPLTGDLIHQATMDRQLVLDVIDLAHASDWHMLVYVDDTVFIEEYRHARSFYSDLLGEDIRRVDDLAFSAKTDGWQPAKFLIVGSDRAASDRMQRQMEERFGGLMHVVRSHDLFVEGNPLGVDKGDALRRLAHYLNVPQERVMAIGDQGNDAPMLRWAGLGVAMGSGSEEARAAADWVAPPYSADGAAVAIERYLLS
jgi:Cof subfamily protein (haloacid dehalogenase superfamily)